MNDAAPAAALAVADSAPRGPSLSPRARAATYALAEALFATEQGPPPAERLAWLCDDLGHFFAHAGPRAAAVYRLCLFAIGLLAPLYVRRAPPFRALPFEERARALEALEASAFGLAVFGAKAPLCFVYYEHPAAAAHAGYDGLCKGARA